MSVHTYERIISEPIRARELESKEGHPTAIENFSHFQAIDKYKYEGTYYFFSLDIFDIMLAYHYPLERNVLGKVGICSSICLISFLVHFLVVN